MCSQQKVKRIYPVHKHCGGTITVVLGCIQYIKIHVHTHCTLHVCLVYSQTFTNDHLSTIMANFWVATDNPCIQSLSPLHNTEPLLHNGNGHLNSLITTTSYSVAEERSIQNLISYCIKVTHILDFCFRVVIVLLIHVYSL